MESRCTWMGSTLFAKCELPEGHSDEHHMVPVGDAGEIKMLRQLLRDLVKAIDAGHPYGPEYHKAVAIGHVNWDKDWGWDYPLSPPLPERITWAVSPESEKQ